MKASYKKSAKCPKSPNISSSGCCLKKVEFVSPWFAKSGGGCQIQPKIFGGCKIVSVLVHFEFLTPHPARGGGGGARNSILANPGF